MRKTCLFTLGKTFFSWPLDAEVVASCKLPVQTSSQPEKVKNKQENLIREAVYMLYVNNIIKIMVRLVWIGGLFIYSLVAVERGRKIVRISDMTTLAEYISVFKNFPFFHPPPTHLCNINCPWGIGLIEIMRVIVQFVLNPSPLVPSGLYTSPLKSKLKLFVNFII